MNNVQNKMPSAKSVLKKRLFSTLRFHVVKRSEMSPFKLAVYYVIGILLAIVFGGVFLQALGANPIDFYITVVTGCFKSPLAIKGLIRIIMPLLICSLGVSVAFRMKFWNIGAEGQFIMGAVCAAYFALFYADKMPAPVLFVVMLLAGAIGGGVFGAIVAYFKCKFGTNETLLTLMFNYIALYIVQLLRDGAWRDPAAGGFPKIAALPKNAWMPVVGGHDATWIICIVLTVILFIYFRFSKQGYEISVVGDSVNTARYAGMNVKVITVRTMFISSAICGIGGMCQVCGDATSHTLTMGIASGVGFTAIIVAWLAKLNPFAIAFVSVMMGILEKGCGVAKSTFSLDPAVAEILQGIILFTVIGFEYFTRYKIARTVAIGKSSKQGDTRKAVEK